MSRIQRSPLLEESVKVVEVKSQALHRCFTVRRCSDAGLAWELGPLHYEFCRTGLTRWLLNERHGGLKALRSFASNLCPGIPLHIWLSRKSQKETQRQCNSKKQLRKPTAENNGQSSACVEVGEGPSSTMGSTSLLLSYLLKQTNPRANISQQKKAFGILEALCALCHKSAPVFREEASMQGVPRSCQG